MHVSWYLEWSCGCLSFYLQLCNLRTDILLLLPVIFSLFIFVSIYSALVNRLLFNRFYLNRFYLTSLTTTILLWHINRLLKIIELVDSTVQIFFFLYEWIRQTSKTSLSSRSLRNCEEGGFVIFITTYYSLRPGIFLKKEGLIKESMSRRYRGPLSCTSISPVVRVDSGRKLSRVESSTCMVTSSVRRSPGESVSRRSGFDNLMEDSQKDRVRGL